MVSKNNVSQNRTDVYFTQYVQTLPRNVLKQYNVTHDNWHHQMSWSIKTQEKLYQNARNFIDTLTHEVVLNPVHLESLTNQIVDFLLPYVMRDKKLTREDRARAVLYYEVYDKSEFVQASIESAKQRRAAKRAYATHSLTKRTRTGLWSDLHPRKR